MGINFEKRGEIAFRGQLYIHLIHIKQLNPNLGLPFLLHLILDSGQLSQQMPQELHSVPA